MPFGKNALLTLIIEPILPHFAKNEDLRSSKGLFEETASNHYHSILR